MKKNRRAWLGLLRPLEGGFVNDPDDPGGPTNMGVAAATLGDFRKLGRPATVEEVQALTRDEAEGIALSRYWNAMRCDQLPGGIDVLAADFAFNSGPGNAAEVLQRLVPVDKVDGFVGDLTISAVRKVKPGKLLESYHNSRMAFLRGLPHWPKFGDGWSSRCDQVFELAKGRVSGGMLAEAVTSPTVVATTTAGAVGLGASLDWIRDTLGPFVSGLPEALQSAEPTMSAIGSAAAKPGPAGHLETLVVTLAALYAGYRRIRMWWVGRT